jgi:hypothetical protein
MKPAARKAKRIIVAAFLGGFLPACAAAAASESIAELQARFDREVNSLQKAKLLQKLGDAQFAESRRAGKEGDFKSVGLLMEKYRDNAREALAAVQKDHPKAEKDSSGYRRLEIHVRHSLRELEETLLVAPPEYRPPLRLVRKDLEDFEDELLRLLFPRRPGEQPVPPAPPPKGS